MKREIYFEKFLGFHASPTKLTRFRLSNPPKTNPNVAEVKTFPEESLQQKPKKKAEPASQQNPSGGISQPTRFVGGWRRKLSTTPSSSWRLAEIELAHAFLHPYEDFDESFAAAAARFSEALSIPTAMARGMTSSLCQGLKDPTLVGSSTD